MQQMTLDMLEVIDSTDYEQEATERSVTTKRKSHKAQRDAGEGRTGATERSVTTKRKLHPGTCKICGEPCWDHYKYGDDEFAYCYVAHHGDPRDGGPQCQRVVLRHPERHVAMRYRESPPPPYAYA
jgi:hypothetical protein